MATSLVSSISEPAGEFTRVEGEEFYRISAYHRLPPFLMSIASDSDLWMFVSSGGGLTAGRVDAEGCLFPYETVDRLHDAHHHTGPITLLYVRRGREDGALWQPFSDPDRAEFAIERHLYKNTLGNRLLFEEINHDLELTFRYRWAASEALGLVRSATLENRSPRAVSVEVLDGFRNVMPHGVPLALMQRSSSLVDAYKRVDCDPATGLGIFSLTAQIVDRAEAVEELRANAVWCTGLDDPAVLLSLDAVAAFRRGEPLATERTLTGRRGNYLVASSLDLPPRASARWHLVADIGLCHLQLATLRSRLLGSEDLGGEIEQSLDAASDNLRRNVASADGLALTARQETDVHHFANVLFNNMRGGVFADGYRLSAADFGAFLRRRHRAVADQHAALVAALPAEITAADLLRAAEGTADPDLERLSREYLPLYFGRRHGDPSRPWNRFVIRVRNDDGSRALGYEGNWRDIFQNWEALGLSFPDFLPSFIAKFVNASTVDGFNPYRVTSEGIDWEVARPEDPWSNIGYWGDHQIVYLLRLLEAMARVSPGALENLLAREIFSYADVPYRLKPYAAIVADPHRTIVYDTSLAARIEERVRALGADGKLLPGPDGGIYHANLLEKLLVPALSKLSNLVPGGGIWMNTQRPEWNDANNALVGHGISVVTLCHLRRYLGLVEKLLAGHGAETAAISTEVVAWFRELSSILGRESALLDARPLDDRDRMRILEAVGEAFSAYRARVYAGGFSGKQPLAVAEVIEFCGHALRLIDHAIRANRREDGLYHAYNLIEIAANGEEARVHKLYEMLEGQVAALSSGLVGPKEAVRLLASLFASDLYRADQRSFLLYPARELPSFLLRNVVPPERVRAVPLLRELVATGERSLLARDALGVHRFHGDIRHARDVAAALDRLAGEERWASAVARDRQAVLDVFEGVFAHRSFTGRSGTMYGYEGLGCIYWHMVTKLLVAVQEVTLRAFREGESAPTQEALVGFYYRIRAGLGFEKTAAEYGAFPTDPYSHTPAFAGAQQPGMTGQVKEEILTRFGELGVHVESGVVSFRPVLLRPSEFRTVSGDYAYYDVEGQSGVIAVPAGGLAFSFCQVPIVYALGRHAARVRVTDRDGVCSELAGDTLDAAMSRALFARCGRIARIDVDVPAEVLCRY